MQRWTCRRAIALVMAGVLVTAPALAADPPQDPDKVNWVKMFDYALCAGGIAAAATGAGLWVAGLACGKIMIEYAD